MIKYVFIICLSLAVLLSLNFNLDQLDSAEAKKIIVVGTAKSGTTAIYKSIKDQLDDKAVSYFEPDDSELKTALRSRRKQVLVKVTLIDREKYKTLSKDIEAFNKPILILRDPRDILISNLLYSVRWMRFSKDTKRFEIFIRALKEKENDPETISVLGLYQLRDRLESEVMRSWESPRNWHDEYNDYAIAVRMIDAFPNIYTLKYEDYIDGRLDGLSSYLALGIKNNADISTMQERHSIKKSLQNIARTKAYGNWKNWFTEEDIQVFKPLFEPLMQKAGYEDEWELNKIQKINPAHSSEYVRRIVETTEIKW